MLKPPILETSWVRLRPLLQTDIPDLLKAAQDKDVWRWFTVDLSDPDRMAEWVGKVLKKQEAGSMIPLAIEDLKQSRLAGSSSYMNIAEEDLCLEIGTTWIGKEFHGTGINYHMKYAMLTHAFEVWGFERVELRTDALNVRSRRAIDRSYL
ncbi:MAG: GNAT family N-acetyltransferase [Bacteroidota bacterium]